MRILILTSLQLSCTHTDGFPMQLRTVLRTISYIQFALVITYQYCDCLCSVFVLKRSELDLVASLLFELSLEN